MSAFLHLESLGLRRGKRWLFRGMHLALQAGDVVAVTGANGSGKSSLLRAVAGLLAPTEGSVTGAENCHYIGHLDAVKSELTVEGHLAYWRVCYGANPLDDVSALEAFCLRGVVGKQGRYLSAGQKRRLSLSRLYLTPRSLWLLDEPTTALDEQGKSLLYHAIAQHRENGGISIIATHQEIAISDVKQYALPENPS